MSYDYTSWDDDRYCIGCGENNPIGMKLNFDVSDGVITAKYTFPREFQGYKRVVHGGMISLLLDEIMVNLPLHNDKVLAVSAEIKVRFKKPLLIGEPVTAKAYYIKKKTKMFIVKGEVVRDSDGVLIAEGEATCLKVEGDLKL